MSQDQPIPGKVYALTGAPGEPAISNGNTWAESEVKNPQVLRDAYAIVSIGASNPLGVAHTIGESIKALRADGIPTPERHPYIRAMVGHLAYLCGVGLGPEIDDLRRVERDYEASERSH